MIKIYDMNEVRDQDIFLRHDAVKDVSQPVAEIIRRVRAEGDAALYHYAREFDKVELSALAVTEQELDEALEEAGAGYVVDGVGRGVALDRDKNYDKVKRAYDAMVDGVGAQYR